MKIKIFTLACLGMMMGFTSCNLDNDDSDNYTQIPYKMCSLVIPQNGDSYPTTSSYYLTVYPYSGSVSLGVNNLIIDGNKVDFATSKMSLTENAYSYEDSNSFMVVRKFSGGTYSQNMVQVNGLSGFASEIIYLPPSNMVANPLYPFTVNYPLVVQYTLNNEYTVKTFSPDAIYNGTTTVTTRSTNESFSDENVAYRVFMKDGYKKADVVFYNGKFAQNMPAINFVVRDLDVVYTKTGYIVEKPADVAQIAPEMFEGGEYTPFPMYQFTRFLLNPTNDQLTEASIEYDIARVVQGAVTENYTCRFVGNYVLDGPKK